MRTILLIIASLVLLAPAAAQADAPPPFAIFPVIGGAHYVDDFGAPRGGGTHEGNDLLAPCGTPVVAVVPGTVTLDWGDRSGWMVTLKGRSSWYRYIHMDGRQGAKSAIAKGLRDGSKVKAGQIISYVGNTGDAAGGPCHLHFEYHKGDRVSSPYAYLQTATIMQLDADNPISLNAVTPQVSLTIKGVIAWTATIGGEGRLIIRPTGISSSDGTKLSHAGTIALRANPSLLPAASVGRAVVVTTTAVELTTALQDIAPLAWTAASVA
ncbi:MAG: M23 family metallopeptidase [Gaiellales bacterium]